MKTVTISTSQNYDVMIGNGLLPQLGQYAANVVKGKTAAIVSDSNVWQLYGELAQQSLQANGFCVVSYVFEAGEESKNGQTYLSILNFLAQSQLTRSDCLIALGGGVVGDMTGFAAATYLRGISYIQVPTSLLAMVDSSIGGKTAIDLNAGKNLAGAFYQPNLVLCDTDVLDSLPEDIFRDGCAEVIKYAILFDADLFSHLQAHGMDFDRESVIYRCVALKRDIVIRDEKDTGERQLLNLGHTIGHSIESKSDFTLSHGKSVAIGLAIVTNAAAKMQICSQETNAKISNLISKFALPITTDFSAQELTEVSLHDKKRFGSTINLILPKDVGNCYIHKLPISELESFIKAGLSHGDNDTAQ